MSYGDGSITEVLNPDGKSYSPKRWRVCFSYMVPVRLQDGTIRNKRKKAQQIVEGSKAHAKAMRDKLREEHEYSSVLADADSLSFGKYASDWHKKRVATAEVGKTRLDREATMVNDIIACIGDLRLRDITPQTIDSMLVAIQANKQEKGSTLSTTTLNMYYKLAKQILGNAVSYDLILRNPCDRVKAPKIADTERRSLNVTEASRLLQVIDDEEARALEKLDSKEERQAKRGNTSSRCRILGLNDLGFIVAVRIGLATGMRRGEVFGLVWENVDLDRCVIRVQESLTVHDEKKNPKSKAGARVLSIDQKTSERLSEWKVRQAEELSKLEIEQSDQTAVCCSSKGDFVKLTNFERWWREFRARNGFPGLRYHELRHTQATQLLGNGVDVKTVQTRLGHANASLTLNQYAHALPENDRDAAALLGQLFDADEPTSDKRKYAYKSASSVSGKKRRLKQISTNVPGMSPTRPAIRKQAREHSL